MKVATSATIFSDAVGMRISVTYSEVDDETGKIIADNLRANRVITDASARETGNVLMGYAQSYIDTLEE